MEGWIKMYRSLTDSEVWNLDRYSKGQAWVDMLLLANHKPNTFFIRGIEMNLEIGQLAYSQVTLSKKWKWNRRTVNKFISWLEKRQMIHSKINKVCTVITILNYNKYQEGTQQSAQQSAQRVHNKVHTNNNVKNVKNNTVPSSKNSLTPCTDEELQAIADSLKVSVENVKLLHSQIIDLIADGTFQKKRYGQTVYFTLRKWITMRVAEGKFKNVTSSIVDKYPTYKPKHESN